MVSKWLSWSLFTIVIASVLTFIMVYEEKSTIFLPGKTTHGHYQIELKCAECHTPMMGVQQDACMKCHEQELEQANDSHPVSKFTDPRNADRVARLDARKCITCHQEHVEDRTFAMGVTLPMDYCLHCHKDIGEERPSHLDLEFDTCATAGCHNFHDNRALYEDFLLKHANEPDVKEHPAVPAREQPSAGATTLTIADADYPAGLLMDDNLIEDWAQTAHAANGVNCIDCHKSPGTDSWVNIPPLSQCAQCHNNEHETFLQGRHGMRLDVGLPPMQPGMARLPMKSEAAHKEIDCNSCHKAHTYDTQFAAADACITCHNDQHSLAYFNEDSPHYQLWQKETNDPAFENQGVSCATCHMPRIEVTRLGETRIQVQHNQNDNLRPNEKMIRSACLHCHGLQFSLDSLASQELIDNNFNGQPTKQVESIDWAVARNP